MITKPPTRQEIRRTDAERLGALGTALGLDPSFIADVQARGIDAILDRAQMIDDTGAQARILGMCQQLGYVLQAAAAKRKRMPDMGMMLQATKKICAVHEVPPALGVYLIGAVVEVYQQAAARLARGENEDELRA